MQRELGLDVHINKPTYKPVYIVQDSTNSNDQRKREKDRLTEKVYRDRKGDIEDVITKGSHRRLRNRQNDIDEVGTKGSHRKKGYRNRQNDAQGSNNRRTQRTKQHLSVV